MTKRHHLQFLLTGAVVTSTVNRVVGGSGGVIRRFGGKSEWMFLLRRFRSSLIGESASGASVAAARVVFVILGVLAGCRDFVGREVEDFRVRTVVDDILAELSAIGVPFALVTPCVGLLCWGVIVVAVCRREVVDTSAAVLVILQRLLGWILRGGEGAEAACAVLVLFGFSGSRGCIVDPRHGGKSQQKETNRLVSVE